MEFNIQLDIGRNWGEKSPGFLLLAVEDYLMAVRFYYNLIRQSARYRRFTKYCEPTAVDCFTLSM